MKQKTNPAQTNTLLSLGFPSPSIYVHCGTDGSSFCAYTIGELIGFLSLIKKDLTVWKDSTSGFWYVDMDDDRVGLDKKLVTALFDACKSQADEIIAQLEKQ